MSENSSRVGEQASLQPEQDQELRAAIRAAIESEGERLRAVREKLVTECDRLYSGNAQNGGME